MAEDKDTENREKIMKEEVDKAVMALIPKLIEHIFDAAAPRTYKPPERKDQDQSEEEIPIYEKLAPGEMLIISRSEKGFLIAANCGGECDIRYYSDTDREE